jgi:hypothetical protein
LLEQLHGRAGGVDLYYLGRLALERGDDRGAALLAQALRLPDGPLEARFHLGKALLRHPRTHKQGRRELELFRRAAPEGELAAEAARLLRGR